MALYQKFTVAGASDAEIKRGIQQKLYEHALNANAGIQIINDGSVDAVFTFGGTTTLQFATPTVEADWTNGTLFDGSGSADGSGTGASYFGIEPKVAMANGNKWQGLLFNGANIPSATSFDHMGYAWSCTGGWANTENGGAGGWSGTEITTANNNANILAWMQDTTYNSPITLRIGSGYVSGYTFFWCLVHEAAGIAVWGLRMGGLIPIDPEDTGPCCVLAGEAQAEAFEADSWTTTTTTNADNQNRAPLEQGTPTSQIASAGYCSAIACAATGTAAGRPHQSRQGRRTGEPLKVRDMVNDRDLGYFSAQELLVMDASVSDLDANAGGTKLHNRGLMFHTTAP